MQASIFKTILTAGLTFLILACNNDKPKKVTVKDVKIEDIRQEEDKPEPPVPPPPQKIKTIERKCYAGSGLSHKIVMTIDFGITDVSGRLESEDMGSGKKETTEFEGKMIGDKLTVKFKTTPPVIGAASEWTDKKWTLKKVQGKEILQVIFNARNYDSNKWEDTLYEFELTDCK